MRAGRSPGAKRASASVDGGRQDGAIDIYRPAMRPRIPERTARRYSSERDGPPFDPAMSVNDLLNPLAGLLVGMLVGFTGVGGGALMTPLLVFMFGVAPQTAVGTDLLFASITKMVGGWVHGKRGSIDWLVLRRLAAGSLPAAALTVALLRYSPQQAGLRALILPALGAALALTSLAMIFQARLHR